MYTEFAVDERTFWGVPRSKDENILGSYVAAPVYGNYQSLGYRLGYISGLYWDNGKENGDYCSIIRYRMTSCRLYRTSVYVNSPKAAEQRPSV